MAQPNGTNNYYAPAANDAGDPAPAAPPGSVPVAANVQQQQQLQQHQVNFLQHHQFVDQLQQQIPQQQQQQQLIQQAAQAQMQRQQSQQAPAPNPNQFVPGPFYTLQQQQAFAQGRLTAAQTLQNQQAGAPVFANANPVAQNPLRPQALVTNPAISALPIMHSGNGSNAATATTSSSDGANPPASTNAAAGQRKRATNLDRPSAKAPAKPKKGSPNSTAQPHQQRQAPRPSSRQPDAEAVPHPGSAAALAATAGMSDSAARLIQNAIAESNSCAMPLPPGSASPAALLAADGALAPTPEATPASVHPPLTAEEKRRYSRDRNREHARCTRLRKKAYVSKLKDLVDGLHAERSEDARRRRVESQRSQEVRNVRKKVVTTFLAYHAGYERDVALWETILESDFWLKQPVTPYRSFPRCEINGDRRVLKGVDAIVRDAASMAVMIETIGSRNTRWMQRKRDDYLTRDAASSKQLLMRHRIGSGRAGASSSVANGGSHMGQIVSQNSRVQSAMSSLSESSESNGSISEGERRSAKRQKTSGKVGLELEKKTGQTTASSSGAQVTDAKKVSSSSSNDTQQPSDGSNDLQQPSTEFHDYHAKPLPDPLLPEHREESPSTDNCVVGKQMGSDSSSSEGTGAAKTNSTSSQVAGTDGGSTNQANVLPAMNARPPPVSNSGLPPNLARSGGIKHNIMSAVQVTALPSAPSVAGTSTSASLPNGHARLSCAPKISTLPPFAGLGKRKKPSPNHQATGSTTNAPQKSVGVSSSTGPPPVLAPIAHHGNNSGGSSSSSSPRGSDEGINNNNIPHGGSRGNLITIDNEYTSASSSQSSSARLIHHHNARPRRGIQCHYHINEDDMIITGNVLMCPFTFRSQDAVWCGSLMECVQPGMLRVMFSQTNKLHNVEMIFDSMGFCQQLERASGSNDGMPEIVPNTLSMALENGNHKHARVITMGKGPEFPVVSVNKAFTRITGYTQSDVEGKDLRKVLLKGGEKRQQQNEEGDYVQRTAFTSEMHDFETVAAKGHPASSTNVHYDVNGKDFLDFMCSFPLWNPKGEVTHIMHVCQELPARS